jgi:multidrug resistance efflux pump
MNTSDGTYVTAGGQLIALVDRSSFWIAAYFKETQLPRIQAGQLADITLMGYENRPFKGIVRSIGWGIYVQDGSGNDTTALLPPVNQTIDWVRLPQRFPVRIHVLGDTPVPLRIGQTVSVGMTPEIKQSEGSGQNVVSQPQ